MEHVSNSEDGIIDAVRNPFAQTNWIEQKFPLTKHRLDQVEQLLTKTVEEIRSLEANSGSYPAFVAIRWNFVEIRDNKLHPTSNWAKWQPPRQKLAPFKNISGENHENGKQPTIPKPGRRSISNSKR